MKMIEALVYPVSFVPAEIVSQLSTLFNQLELLLPSDLNRAKITDLLGESARLVRLTAVPFESEKELDKYEAMMKDFKAWASQIGLGMGTTASALYESVRSGFPHDIQAITDVLKGQSRQDPLLEARLFLEFALEYDLEQELLEGELRDISKKAEKIETIMAGPDKDLEGTHYGVPPQTLEPFHRRITQVKGRLEAWFRLYMACCQKCALFASPLGVGIEVKDVIDETYESTMGKELPLEIFKIGLASLSRVDEKERETVIAAISWITSQLSEEPVEAVFKEIEQEAAKLEDMLPAQDRSLCLTLTHYPGAKWIDLMAGGSKKQKEHPFFATKANWSFYIF